MCVHGPVILSLPNALKLGNVFKTKHVRQLLCLSLHISDNIM